MKALADFLQVSGQDPYQLPVPDSDKLKTILMEGKETGARGRLLGPGNCKKSLPTGAASRYNGRRDDPLSLGPVVYAGGNEMLAKSPQFVVSDGKPVAVILDIEVYREILERLEDLEDLKYLEEIRKNPIELKSLDDFLAEHDSKV